MIIPSRHGILEIHMEIAHGIMWLKIKNGRNGQVGIVQSGSVGQLTGTYMFANIYICHNHMKWLSTVNRESALG